MSEEEEEHHDNNQIGDLNGKWSVLFRALLTVLSLGFPFIVALQVWFVNAIYGIKIEQEKTNASLQIFMAAGPRYTQVNADKDILELEKKILKEVEAKYPPDWLTDEVESLSRRVQMLEKKP